MKRSLVILLFAPLLAWGQAILLYTETEGFDHNTRNETEAMYNTLAQTHGWTITHDTDGSEFNSLANLGQYDLIVFANTSGIPLTDAEESNMEQAVQQEGIGFVGIHAATDTYRHSSANGSKTGGWDWYAENMTGASVQQSPNHTNQNHNNTMTHSEPGHPTLAAVPAPWNKTEEYYYWENGYLNSNFNELLQVGSTGGNSYDAPRMTAQYFEHSWGSRVFYTSLGHATWNYTDPDFVKLIENATLWALDDGEVTGLPLELLDFHIDKETYQLIWVTAEEINTDRVEIERRRREGFSIIGEVASQKQWGPQTYRYRVLDIRKGDLYRLRFVDRDGSYTYSQVLQAAFDAQPQWFDAATQRLRVGTDGPIQVYDGQGRHLLTAHRDQFLPFAPGLYLLRKGDRVQRVLLR